MLFWIVIALISAAVVIAITYPLMVTAQVHPGPQPIDAAQAIYEAQLSELQRDAANSGMTSADVDAARTELARRLLRAAKSAPQAVQAASREPQMRNLALALSVFVPVGAVAVYLSVGAPGVPSQTAEARVDAIKERARDQSLVSALETVLASGKGDAQGWMLLVNAYKNLGEPAKSLDALKRAAPWLKQRGLAVPGDLSAALGRGLVAEAQGVVTPRAAAAFQDVLSSDPQNLSARFYLGLERQQQGDWGGARRYWEPLHQSLPDGTPLRADLENRLNALPAAR